MRKNTRDKEIAAHNPWVETRVPANQSGQLAPELRVQNFVGQDIRRRSRHQTDKAKEAAGLGRLVFVVVYLPAATLQKEAPSYSWFFASFCFCVWMRRMVM